MNAIHRQPVLSSSEKTLSMLEEYARGSMTFRMHSEKLTGSVVSMRKALEMMVWGLRIYLSPTEDRAKWSTRHDIEKALEHTPKDFYDVYLSRTDPMLYEIKALALGAPGQEGISKYLHYQGVRVGKGPYCDYATMLQAERASIAYAYAQFIGCIGAFSSLMQRFLIRVGLDGDCTQAGHPTLCYMLKEGHTYLSEIQTSYNIEAFEHTLDALHPDEYWLDYYCGILNQLAAQKDNRISCDTVFACCRLIAERYCAFVLHRYDSMNSATAPVDRSCYTLQEYLSELEALPAPRKLVDLQNMKDRLERVRQIQKQANLMEHFLNVSYEEETLKLPPDEKQQFDLNMDQMTINCSVLVQEMVNESLPASVHEWIDSRIGRVRVFSSASSRATSSPVTGGSFNFYEEIRSIFEQKFREKKDDAESSWIKSKLQKKRQVPKAPAPQQRDQHEQITDHHGYLQQPSCLKKPLGIGESSNFTVVDCPEGITRAYKIDIMLIPRRRQFISIATPVAHHTWPLDNGDKSTRFDIPRQQYDHDGSDIWGNQENQFILLTFFASGKYFLNSAISQGDSLFVSKKPMLLGKTLLPSRRADEILRRKMMENASMHSLTSLGILHISQAESAPQENGTERIECPFDESYFQYAIFDPDTAEPVIPQLYVDEGGQLCMRLDIDPSKEYVCLEIVEKSDSDDPVDPTFFHFGVGYLHGVAGVEKDIMKAADWFHAGLMANPMDYDCAYELGCLFRYIPELQSDEDAYEYLNIAAKGGHKRARYEIAKLILQQQKDDTDVLRARQYILELLDAGYKCCGDDRITDLLDNLRDNQS